MSGRVNILQSLSNMNEPPKISFLKKDNTKLEFEIFRISSLFSRQSKLDHSLEAPHRVEFFNIMFVTKGTGTHFIDFQSYKYSAGSILFISKGQVHAFEASHDLDGFLILFTEDFLSKNLIHSDILSLYRLYNYHLHSPIIQPDEIKEDIFNYIVDEIYREYSFTDKFAKEEILRLLLKLLLLKAERLKRTLIRKEKNSKWLLKFGDFRSQLETHFTETRNANEYARMMNISYKHLNEICKSVTGISAKAFIDNFIILEIKRRIAISGDSVKELTYQLGFDEPTNFVKFFKKHTLLSPVQFRNKLIK